MSRFYSAATGGFYDSRLHGGSIPADAVSLTDAEYGALLAQQGQGMEIRPGQNGRPVAMPAPPPAPPREVTNFQARAVLMAQPGSAEGRSLFQDVDDALRAQGGVAWQAWEYANTVSRGGELVRAMAAQLGLSEAALDALFIAAAAVEA